VQVRRAVLGDAPGIAGVHLKAWYGEYGGALPPDVLDSFDPTQRLPHWPAVLEQAAWPGRGTLIAEDGDGAVLGFSNISPSRDQGQEPAGVAVRNVRYRHDLS
jgi:hypothetical protein